MDKRVLAGTLALAFVPVLAHAQYFFAPVRSGGITVEAASGTRDAGAFGRHGSEAALSGRFAGASGFTLAAHAGFARNTQLDRNETALGAAAGWQAQAWGAVAGWRRDYAGVSIPYAGFALWPTDRTAASLRVELPQGGDRDAADLLLALGARLPCGARLGCALELAGEDLEGFFDEREAEGGARFILGPSASWTMAPGRGLRLFGGWIHAATANEPRAGQADYRGHRDGLMVRLALDLGAP